jgi:hypothetical protein
VVAQARAAGDVVNIELRSFGDRIASMVSADAAEQLRYHAALLTPRRAARLLVAADAAEEGRMDDVREILDTHDILEDW